MEFGGSQGHDHCRNGIASCCRRCIDDSDKQLDNDIANNATTMTDAQLSAKTQTLQTQIQQQYGASSQAGVDATNLINQYQTDVTNIRANNAYDTVTKGILLTEAATNLQNGLNAVAAAASSGSSAATLAALNLSQYFPTPNFGSSSTGSTGSTG
jgi:hypothetical protein